jgi:aminodeoxychorismate lyase
MIFYLNGRFVPEENATVSVLDRSFLYGDGIFESIRVYAGRIFMWKEHMERFTHGAKTLHIRMPTKPAELAAAAAKLLDLNGMRDAVLRIQLTRGVGNRGYSIKGADHPQIVMTIHPAPEVEETMPRWSLWISSVRVPAHDPLGVLKTNNKLPQIVARMEAELAGANEAVLLNTDGLVAEAASSNLFWVENGEVFTPPLGAGALAGITRRHIMGICRELGIECGERSLAPSQMLSKDGIFLTMSSFEIVEVASINSKPVASSPVTIRLREAYRTAVAKP